jgi:hypothetical protein
MAHDNRGVAGVLVVVNVQVCAADAGRLDLDQYVAGKNVRFRRLQQANITLTRGEFGDTLHLCLLL